jgi:alpha-glucosidase
MKKILVSFCLVLLIPVFLQAQKPFIREFRSPDGNITLKIEAGTQLVWSVTSGNKQIIEPSPVSMTLQGGEVLGNNARPSSPKIEKINTSFNALNYRKTVVSDICTQVTLNFKGNYGVIFRIYDDAVAYRFFTRRTGELVVMNEEANFNFSNDYKTFVPIQWDYRDRQKFNSSFEALYREIKFSQFPKDSLAFLPVLVDIGDNIKAEIFEIDLEDYPGMYLDLNQTGKGFKGVYAPFPLETYTKSLNIIPSKRADYIAKTTGNRNFPWRAVVISKQDKDLLDIDIVQKLASPPRFSDISWIKVGQVSWDWWNSLNISHVDFRAGMNTPTYKYFIDFAAKYHVPFILIDAGWNVPGDLTRPKTDLSLDELVAYGNSKGVGVWVWCSWKDVLKQMETAFPYFAKTGIKGLKIDFFDRDDQIVVASTYEIAKNAAGLKLMVDYHGIYKPTGLQRTYPNVVGIEGVKGGENYKWANENQPRYCVTIPFIRNQAGPMDYTSGAMRNSNQANYRAIDDMPMSKGTRVNQLAHYIVFEVPIQMLSDNPTAYMKEHECTEFITKVPTTWEETVPLDGKVAEYVSIARRRGDTWFAAAMTNWTPRELTVDLSFLGEGTYRAEIFSDGVNADRDATDYKKEVLDVTRGDKLNIKLMNGGGWAARFERK